MKVSANSMPNYQIACNGCGAGKPTYFKRYNPSIKEGDGHAFTFVPFESIQSKVEVTELASGCPKCGCKDLEIIKPL